jgi:hypothetical membrane protein
MGMITAEALYPGYHTGVDTISYLASAEPSATIFNASIILAGSLYIVGAALFNRCEFRWWLSVPTMLMGVGTVGVGLFPLYTGAPHAVFAIMAFGSGSMAAVLSSRILKPPFKYISLVLGAVALFALVLFSYMWMIEPFGPLGEGGMERWVAYPVFLWGFGFGGYLMGGAGKDRQ